MPSPIGHALAGIVAAWGADLVPGEREWRTAPASASLFERAGNGLTFTCIALAVAPDLDLFFGSFHRSVTHSFTAVVVVAVVTGLMAVRTGRPAVRVASTCAGAWATHLLLDWLGADHFYPYGIQLLWPFSSAWFISGWDLFAWTERRQVMGAAAMKQNAAAAALEIALLMPIVLGLWSIRVKALARLSTELARRDHPAK